VTGDLIDGPGGIEPCIANLKKLKPKKGTYVVLGNHDYKIFPFIHQIKRIVTGRIIGVDRPETELFKKRLIEEGLGLLINEHVRLDWLDGLAVNIIGIDDPITGRANYNQAFQGIRDAALQLALIHSPTHFAVLEKHDIDAAFAGHTHGGQIRIPGMGPLPLVYHIEPIIDSTDRYGFPGIVSRGMGASPFLRIRLFCRPEALLVVIKGEKEKEH
jgi:predicted MPP superfamily phosphohydrolase